MSPLRARLALLALAATACGSSPPPVVEPSDEPASDERDEPAEVVGPSAPAVTEVGPELRGQPLVLQGTSGGPIAAGTLHPGCSGHVAQAPLHMVRVTAALPELRLTARSGSDTTLVVRLADGTFLCDDDGAGQLNPLVRLSPAPPGTLAIWVGSYRRDESAAYVLELSAAVGSGGPAPPPPNDGTGVVQLEEAQGSTQP